MLNLDQVEDVAEAKAKAVDEVMAEAVAVVEDADVDKGMEEAINHIT